MSFPSRNFICFYKLPTVGCDMSRPFARLSLCGHCGLRCGAYARSSTRFSTRIVCDHCNFGETRLLWRGHDIVEPIHVVHIHRHRRLRGGRFSAAVDAARSSFATPSPAPCSFGTSQWPLVLSGILSSFFQHPNLISFYIFSLKMLQHFEVRSKLLSLFRLLHCVTVMSSLFLHFSIVNSLLRITGVVKLAWGLFES
jgi:hypothetical protein